MKSKAKTIVEKLFKSKKQSKVIDPKVLKDMGIDTIKVDTFTVQSFLKDLKLK